MAYTEITLITGVEIMDGIPIPMTLDLSGVNPANIVPFSADGKQIHEQDLRRHLAELGDIDGVNGIVTNGHAGEVYALDRSERVRVVELADEATDSDTPVVSGVVAGSTREVITETRAVADAGADGILMVPPHTPISERADAARAFFEDVSDATDVPIVIFQHPNWAGGHYAPDLLADLATVENVVGVKDAVWDVDHFQEDYRALRDSSADVQVLVANDEHLLPSYSIGADGTILELAAVIPHEIIELFDAVAESDLERARIVYERIEPFIDAMYEPPISDSHTRLKVALRLEGKIEHSTPRPPAAPIPNDEVERIRQSMEASDLL